jgi:hypothetical protein
VRELASELGVDVEPTGTAVIDHFSHDPADPSHATVVAAGFVDSKAVFGGRSPVGGCALSLCTMVQHFLASLSAVARLLLTCVKRMCCHLQAPVLYRGVGLSVPPESSLVSTLQACS